MLPTWFTRLSRSLLNVAIVTLTLLIFVSQHVSQCNISMLTELLIDQTEESLGKAIRESNVPREEVFVTTKLWGTFRKPEHVRPAFERSLKDLQFEYIDMYMLHWPMAWEFHGYEHDKLQVKDENGDLKVLDIPLIDTWREMEKLVKDGLVRNIGVSNCTIPMLEELLKEAEIPPCMNQVNEYRMSYRFYYDVDN